MNETERKIVTLKNNQTRYCVLGPKMGVDFHFFKDGWDVCAGLECHYRERPNYLEGQEPLSEDCWLHGGRCWGDGTSLYATEYLYPLFDALGVEDFWPILEEEYHKRLRDAFGPPDVASLAPGMEGRG